MPRPLTARLPNPSAAEKIDSLPASALSLREEVRRLIGVLNAGEPCVLALANQAAGEGQDRPTAVVKLSRAMPVNAALALVCAARRPGPHIDDHEASHVRRAAS